MDEIAVITSKFGQLRTSENVEIVDGMQGVRGSNPRTSIILAPYLTGLFECFEDLIHVPRPLVQQLLQQLFHGESNDTSKIQS